MDVIKLDFQAQTQNIVIDDGFCMCQNFVMDQTLNSREFIRDYSRLFHLFYRRRDPRAYRPRPETTALLEHLTSSGPLTIAEVSNHLDISQSASSEQMARMIKRGLISRIPDEVDRRRHLVWLTPRGRKLLTEERQVLSAELIARAIDNMTLKQQRNLQEGIGALIEAAIDLQPQSNHFPGKTSDGHK